MNPHKIRRHVDAPTVVGSIIAPILVFGACLTLYSQRRDNLSEGLARRPDEVLLGVRSVAHRLNWPPPEADGDGSLTFRNDDFRRGESGAVCVVVRPSPTQNQVRVDFSGPSVKIHRMKALVDEELRR